MIAYGLRRLKKARYCTATLVSQPNERLGRKRGYGALSKLLGMDLRDINRLALGGALPLARTSDGLR